MAAAEDDKRVAQLLRLLRRRDSLTQIELAERAAVPRRVVQLIEGGKVAEVRLHELRRAFEALDGRARLSTWWHGAGADRLLDERHAHLSERAIGVIRLRLWLTKAEVTFSEYGERGSLDIFAGRPSEGAVLVGEVKSDIGSLEETNRVLDAKERLAPKLAAEQFGFVPRFVGRILILPDEMRLRRLVAAHGATMESVYPARGREVREWLRHPIRPLRGIWFLSDARPEGRELP